MLHGCVSIFETNETKRGHKFWIHILPTLSTNKIQYVMDNANLHNTSR